MWSLEYEKEGAETQKVRPQKSGVYMEEPILRVWLQAYIVGVVTGFIFLPLYIFSYLSVSLCCTCMMYIGYPSIMASIISSVHHEYYKLYMQITSFAQLDY